MQEYKDARGKPMSRYLSAEELYEYHARYPSLTGIQRLFRRDFLHRLSDAGREERILNKYLLITTNLGVEVCGFANGTDFNQEKADWEMYTEQGWKKASLVESPPDWWETVNAFQQLKGKKRDNKYSLYDRLGREYDGVVRLKR